MQMGMKNEEAPESRKSCSGAVRGLVNLFPRFSEFQDFILTRPHFYSSEQMANRILEMVAFWGLFCFTFLPFLSLN